jgi:sulfite exporter TauE/SafE
MIYNGSLLAGLVLGLAGSLHCVGMCGPLVLMMPSGWLGLVVYHLGRTFTYVLMGLLAGLMFQVVDIRAFQSEFSIGVGLVFLVMWVYQRWGWRIERLVGGSGQGRGVDLGESQSLGFLSGLRARVLQLYASAMKEDDLRWRAVAGFANGLLPCGLVYGALMAAVGQGTTGGSMFLMMGFGLGSMPSLFVLGLVGSRIGSRVRKYWSKLLPWWLLLMGIWFVLRGLNLGIPYLSPDVKMGVKHGSCCAPK